MNRAVGTLLVVLLFLLLAETAIRIYAVAYDLWSIPLDDRTPQERGF